MIKREKTGKRRYRVAHERRGFFSREILILQVLWRYHGTEHDEHGFRDVDHNVWEDARPQDITEHECVSS